MGRRQFLQRICNVFGQRKHFDKKTRVKTKSPAEKRGVFDDNVVRQLMMDKKFIVLDAEEEDLEVKRR